MKKEQVIHTPHGDAVVLRFLIMKGFASGVKYRVKGTGEEHNEFRTLVDRWQVEAAKVQA